MGCAIKGHMLLETYVVLNNNLFKEKLLQQNMKKLKRIKPLQLRQNQLPYKCLL